MRKAGLSFFLLFFSYAYSMVDVACTHDAEKARAESTLASVLARPIDAKEQKLWEDVFDEHDPHTISPDHNEKIEWLLAACEYKTAKTGEKNVDLRRLVFDRLCKKANDQNRRKTYDSQAVQRAWQQCASEWDGAVSSIELLQPKTAHQAIHLAAYFLANLYEKALPAVTEEMVSAEEEHPTPRRFSDAFIELKYRQYKDLFDQISSAHPTLKPQIDMYLYLVTPEVLRQRLEPFFQENVAVERFLKTYAAPSEDQRTTAAPKAPVKESFTAVEAFIPTGCKLLRQLADLKNLTEDQKESFLKKCFTQEAGVIYSHIAAQSKKITDVPRLLSPIEHNVIGIIACYAIQEKCSKKIAFLLSRYCLGINTFFNILGTPTTFLYLATMNGDLECINALLGMGANPFAKTTYTTYSNGRMTNVTTNSPYELAKKLSGAPHTRITKRPFLNPHLKMTFEDAQPANVELELDAAGHAIFEPQEYDCTQELRGDDDHAFDQKLYALYQEIIKRFDEEIAQRAARASAPKPTREALPVTPVVNRNPDHPEQALVGPETDTRPKDEWELTKDPGMVDSKQKTAGPSASKYIKNPPENPEPGHSKKKRSCCNWM